MNAGTGPVDCANHFNDYLDDQTLRTCHVCLTTPATIMLYLHGLTGSLSFVSLVTLLGIIGRNHLRRRAQFPNRNWRIFQRNIDIMIFNLIIGDIVMSLGSITSFRWAYGRQVFCGGYCSTQGAFRILGDTVAAMSTLEIAVYTFLVIRRNSPVQYNPRACMVMVSFMWLWGLSWAIVPHHLKKGRGVDTEGNVQDFFAPTPWWCWINGKYMTERIVGEYIWLWIAGAGSMLYVPTVLIVYRQAKAGRVYHPGEQSQADAGSVASARIKYTEVAKLLLYPAAYAFCVLPMSITRWITFIHPNVISSPRLVPAVIFCVSIFNLMGFFNVMLTLYIRPTILSISYKDEVELSHRRPPVGQAEVQVFRVPSSTSGSWRSWRPEEERSRVEEKSPLDQTRSDIALASNT